MNPCTTKSFFTVSLLVVMNRQIFCSYIIESRKQAEIMHSLCSIAGSTGQNPAGLPAKYAHIQPATAKRHKSADTRANQPNKILQFVILVYSSCYTTMGMRMALALHTATMCQMLTFVPTVCLPCTYRGNISTRCLFTTRFQLFNTDRHQSGLWLFIFYCNSDFPVI